MKHKKAGLNAKISHKQGKKSIYFKDVRPSCCIRCYHVQWTLFCKLTLAPLVIFMCYVNIILVFVCFAEIWKIAKENYYSTPTVLLHFGKKYIDIDLLIIYFR